LSGWIQRSIPADPAGYSAYRAGVIGRASSSFLPVCRPAREPLAPDLEAQADEIVAGRFRLFDGRRCRGFPPIGPPSAPSMIAPFLADRH
jgi:hypothetical protein